MNQPSMQGHDQTENSPQDKAPICGQCGEQMMLREVSACLDCGGLQGDLAEFKSKKRTFFKVGMLDQEVICDFCLADISHYDPPYYGFPEGFNWTQGLKNSSMEAQPEAAPKKEWACSNSKCENTLRRQEFITKNASRNKVELPKAFWPFIS